MNANEPGSVRKPLYFEDFSVGQHFSSGSYVMTAEKYPRFRG